MFQIKQKPCMQGNKIMQAKSPGTRMQRHQKEWKEKTLKSWKQNQHAKKITTQIKKDTSARNTMQWMERSTCNVKRKKVPKTCFSKNTCCKKGCIARSNLFFTTKSRPCLGRKLPATMGGYGLAYPSLYKFPSDANAANIQRHVRIAKQQISQSQGM